MAVIDDYDYEAVVSETVNFLADADEAMMDLVLTDDNIVEGLEYFLVTMTLVAGTDTESLGELYKAIVFIQDDDEKSKSKVNVFHHQS